MHIPNTQTSGSSCYFCCKGMIPVSTNCSVPYVTIIKTNCMWLCDQEAIYRCPAPSRTYILKLNCILHDSLLKISRHNDKTGWYLHIYKGIATCYSLMHLYYSCCSYIASCAITAFCVNLYSQLYLLCCILVIQHLVTSLFISHSYIHSIIFSLCYNELL